MGKIIGIDLGTTNSVVSVVENGKAKTITNAEGSYTTPSVVAFPDKDEVLVGQLAKRQAVSNPERTIFSSKSFIGRQFSEMSQVLNRFPFKVKEKSGKGSCVFEVNGKDYSPEQIGAFVLSKLKRDAESYLGQEVKEAVITVPAYFNDSQRQATKNAGRIAGLDVKRIINEPTAAALAYGLDKKENRVIAVYDFGGGTFDISILEIANEVIEVKATNGNMQLGGDDFDEVIFNWLREEFKKQEGVDLSTDKMASQRLREAAEKAKTELSTVQETAINLPFITATDSGPKHLDMKLSRAKFDQLTEGLIKQSLDSCKKALEDADLAVSDIHETLLIGGTTRIPAVQKAVEGFFGKAPNQSVNPDQVVSNGATIQGGILSHEVKDVLLLDVTPLSLGIETLGGITTRLVEKNTTIPVQRSEIFSTAEDNQSTVSIHVVQGEREFAKDNKTLGRFNLSGVKPAPRGVPQIEVTFDIDVNGIIHVSAKDKNTGMSQKIQIVQSQPDEKEIERMVKEAEIYEEKDKEKRRVTVLKNEIEQICYQSEKLMKEQKNVDSNTKSKVEQAIQKARSVIAKSDVDVAELEGAKQELQSEYQALGSQLYEAQKSQGNSSTQESPSSSQNGGSGETIDADYKKEE